MARSSLDDFSGCIVEKMEVVMLTGGYAPRIYTYTSIRRGHSKRIKASETALLVAWIAAFMQTACRFKCAAFAAWSKQLELVSAFLSVARALIEGSGRSNQHTKAIAALSIRLIAASITVLELTISHLSKMSLDMDDFSGCMIEQMEVVMPTGGHAPRAYAYTSSNEELADAVEKDPRISRTLSFLQDEEDPDPKASNRFFSSALVALAIVMGMIIVLLSCAVVYLSLKIRSSGCNKTGFF
eukprot:IDg23654t1